VARLLDEQRLDVAHERAAVFRGRLRGGGAKLGGEGGGEFFRRRNLCGGDLANDQAENRGQHGAAADVHNGSGGGIGTGPVRDGIGA
jgi:hypothetical protein